ncbi:Rv1733c family protein [Cryptosporangium japonicum]|uniref:Transmembrane protein n=1 Tax=Cryptosporangium japonicum TaxID=80872 RepID=A0ABN0UNW6_9ACTN
MRQPKYTRGRRALRLLGLTRSPLRRRVDRLERTLRMFSALAVLAVSVISFLVVLGTYHRGLDEAAALRSHLRQVPVVLLAETSGGRTAVGSVPPAPGPGVPATWTLPDGTMRTGNVFGAPPGAIDGASVEVWMDQDFTPVRPPVEPADLRFRAGATVIGCVSMFGLMIWGLYQWGRGRLDERRDADWTREWLLFERQWRDRLH